MALADADGGALVEALPVEEGGFEGEGVEEVVREAVLDFEGDREAEEEVESLFCTAPVAPLLAEVTRDCCGVCVSTAVEEAQPPLTEAEELLDREALTDPLFDCEALEEVEGGSVALPVKVPRLMLDLAVAVGGAVPEGNRSVRDISGVPLTLDVVLGEEEVEAESKEERELLGEASGE